MIKQKLRLLYILYFTINSITIIMKILIKKKKFITFINKNKMNTIITILIKNTKEFLKMKCKSNFIIKKILILI